MPWLQIVAAWVLAIATVVTAAVPLPWRRWLYRLSGADKEVGGLRAEVHELRAELVGYHGVEKRLNATINSLLDPIQTSACTKMRLRDQDEAEDYARLVERETGREVGALAGYRCKVCPRQPRLLSRQEPVRYWHIANVNRGERSSGRQPQRTTRRRQAAARSDRDGTRIRDRIDPTILDKLKGH